MAATMTTAGEWRQQRRPTSAAPKLPRAQSTVSQQQATSLLQPHVRSVLVETRGDVWRAESPTTESKSRLPATRTTVSVIVQQRAKEWPRTAARRRGCPIELAGRWRHRRIPRRAARVAVTVGRHGRRQRCRSQRCRAHRRCAVRRDHFGGRANQCRRRRFNACRLAFGRPRRRCRWGCLHGYDARRPRWRRSHGHGLQLYAGQRRRRRCHGNVALRRRNGLACYGSHCGRRRRQRRRRR